MEGHAKKCVERYCELANKTTQQLNKVSTPCIDDHHFKEEELKSVRELSKVCSQIVLKCLYLARIGRPDILWSVNKLARSITKWTKACDKRLSRLISYVHHTCDYKQYCHVGNTAKQCRLGLFQDSDFAKDLEDSKSTSHRVNDQVRKKQNQSSKNATKDSDKHSVIWGMFMSSTLQASVFMEKNYSDELHSIKNTEDLTLKQMFDISGNWCPNKMRSMEQIQLTGNTLHGSIYLWFVMKKSSVSCTQRSKYSQILYYAFER